ncbi:MAG: metalloprotease PmbA [Succinivibrio sp.]|nr:metalloprotease PmbA [Succinivibrio sp.]
MSFKDTVRAKESALKDLAAYAVAEAKSMGAFESVVSIGGAEGISVSSRGGEIENLEFNKDQGMEITVYVSHKRGSASTTDLTHQAIRECIQSALSIASFTDEDPCAGIADAELLCQHFPELDILYPAQTDADAAVATAVSLEQYALEHKDEAIKNSDGAEFSSAVFTTALANSAGFCSARSLSNSALELTLIGQSDGKMQRGCGFDVHCNYQAFKSKEDIFAEAQERTLEMLNAHAVKTGKYNIIFSRNAMTSLWSSLLTAMSGGAIYRRSSYLCDMLGKQILPPFLTLLEDPLVKGERASKAYDSEGVAMHKSELIKGGILEVYLLSSYSSRKLGLKSNGHADGTSTCYALADAEHTKSFDELLQEAGEGIVVTSLMGQGVDIISGNYSRGATGYYFRNGQREHAVEEITIAGNLKEMFHNLALVGTDIDPRYKLKSGSLLIPDMTVSGL